METRDLLKVHLATFLVVLAGVLPMRARAAPFPSSFTYQGRLEQGGVAVNNVCDFQFSVWDTGAGGVPPSGGSQQGATLPIANQVVMDGLFSFDPNFGDGIFTGDDRWLQIAVRCPAGNGSYTTLSPRQRLTAAPYALHARAAETASSATTASGLACSGCVNGTDIATATITSQQIAAGTIQPSHLAFTPGTVTQITTGAGLAGGPITTSGALEVDFGTTEGTVATGNHDHDARYWKRGGNPGVPAGTNVLGTTDNQPVELHVNGQRAFRLQPASSPNLVGGWAGNSVDPAVMGGSIGGGGGLDDNGMPAPNRISGDFGVVAGGLGNTAGIYATVAGGAGNTANVYHATIGGGARNSVEFDVATIAGGRDNKAQGYATAIGGGVDNIAVGQRSAIGGGSDNVADGFGATIGGGFGNQANATYATIGGGGRTDGANPATGNLVTDDYGTIGGGGDNQAGNDNMSTTDAVGATVGGGGSNFASNAHATVGGGFLNFASGLQSTVGGGTTNVASGNVATVPGGFFNSAAGTGSFAAGVNAHAAHSGSFVWSDGTGSEASTGPNQFVARATGGFRLRYGTGPGDYCIVTNSTGWHCSVMASDRNVKANFAPVEGREVLTRLTTVPIQTWNYASQEPSVRHIGPMAQDFYAAFKAGEDDKHIDPIDANGVALAAIQGLHQLVQERDAEIAALTARLAALERQIGEACGR